MTSLCSKYSTPSSLHTSFRRSRTFCCYLSVKPRSLSRKTLLLRNWPKTANKPIFAKSWLTSWLSVRATMQLTNRIMIIKIPSSFRLWIRVTRYLTRSLLISSTPLLEKVRFPNKSSRNLKSSTDCLRKYWLKRTLLWSDFSPINSCNCLRRSSYCWK